MAELLENEKVKLGAVIHVKNVEEGKTESPTYQAIQVENEDGKDQFCILLTNSEFQKLSTMVLPENLIKEFVPGRIYTIYKGPKETNWIRLFNDGFTFLAQIPTKLITRATKRADKHPESVTKKSFLEDLLD